MAKRLFELIMSIKQLCQENEVTIREDLNLSQAEFNAFLVLKTGEEIHGNTLAERMRLSPSRSSRVLNTLVKKQFVSTSFAPEDRRSIFLTLTAQGVRVKNQIDARLKGCEERICSHLNETNINQVREALELLETVL